ncbi:restriction endonuclease [Lentibacillus sediminis]|uniref:restriction endonuclease n=1 Tax=Lentibacillus sediminis TaxID=1940529 RepID=UPI001EFEE089|nr:restriction endonuclease [Lentibacillus sediminis]
MEFMGFFEGLLMGPDLLWSILTAEPLLTVSLFIFFGGGVLFALAVRAYREYRLRKSGMPEVDKMSGAAFERYLQVLFKARGYKANLTPATGDYGADLVLSFQGKKIVVQAKRYKKKVGVRAIQEISSAKSYYKADECWLITNNYYTSQAIKLASSNTIRLIDRDELMKWMIQQKKSA